MKTEQEITSRITSRITELKVKLKSELAGQAAVLAAKQFDLDNKETISRLDGNIGALEWVLRLARGEE